MEEVALSSEPICRVGRIEHHATHPISHTSNRFVCLIGCQAVGEPDGDTGIIDIIA